MPDALALLLAALCFLIGGGILLQGRRRRPSRPPSKGRDVPPGPRPEANGLTRDPPPAPPGDRGGPAADGNTRPDFRPPES